MPRTLNRPSEEKLATDDAEIARLAAAETHSWWVRGRRALVAAIVRKYAPSPMRGTICDLGCGAGAMWEVLQEYGLVIGVDRSLLSMRLCRARGYAGLVLGAVEQLPLASSSLDLAGMTDVLEHIEDDEGAIRECARVLRPGGILVLTVPAFPFLFGRHDRALGHFRRYSPRRLMRVLHGNGFKVERLTHFNTIMLPGIVLVRLLRGLFSGSVARADALIFPGALNRLAYGTLALERLLLQHVDLPLGVSLLCVARSERV